MNYQTHQKRRIGTSRIIAIYVLFGLAWVYGLGIPAYADHDSGVMATDVPI